MHRLLIKGSVNMGGFPGKERFPPVLPLPEKAALPSDFHGFVQTVFVVADLQILIAPFLMGRIPGERQLFLFHGPVLLIKEIHEMRS